MPELGDGLLEGQVVLVSGGTQGLRAAVAGNGAAVVVTGRRREAGERVAAQVAGRGGRPTSSRVTSPTWPSAVWRWSRRWSDSTRSLGRHDHVGVPR